MAEDTETSEEQAPKWFRDAMAASAAETKVLREQVASMSKDKVFTDAGIPAEKVGKLFRDAYTGDMSVDAIKAAATEYGILEPPAPKTDPVDQETHKRIFDAATTEDRVSLPQDQFDALNNAGSVEEVNASLDAMGLLHQKSF